MPRHFSIFSGNIRNHKIIHSAAYLFVLMGLSLFLMDCSGRKSETKPSIAETDPIVREDIEKPKPDFSEINTVVRKEIAKGSFPGAVVLVGRDEEILYHRAFGQKQKIPVAEPMSLSTIFDLASLTKPIATATSVLMLYDRGKLKLTDPAGTYLPDFAGDGREDIQIHHLLTHTSGLPAYTSAASLQAEFGPVCPAQVIAKICRLKLQSKPGEKFRYSCLGYILLSEVVKKASGQSLDRFAREHLFQTLNMTDTGFTPAEKLIPRIAATEIVDGCPLRGRVHDPLARLRDGISGNAGLFSTAHDLSLYCRLLVNDGTYGGVTVLSSEAVSLLTTPQAFGRAYGFGVSSPYAWIKGSSAPPATFCHSGYTGTSLVCDPIGKTYLIILTNRVHPHDKGTVKVLRTRLADIVFRTLGSPPAGQAAKP